MMIEQQPEQKDITELHKRLVTNIQDLEDEIAERQVRQDRMKAVVENLEALYDYLPSYAAGASEESPRGQEAARRVLRESHGEWLDIPAIVTELRLRRWIDKDAKDPEAAVRVSLRRLGGEVEQRRIGRRIEYRITEGDDLPDQEKSTS
jgi:hypothetical protein